MGQCPGDAPPMPRRYTITDGKIILELHPAEEGGYTVTSPLDPGLITEAETLEEAFRMAYDAQKCLREARAKLAKRLGYPVEGKSRRTAETGVPSPHDPAVPAAIPPTRRRSR